MNIAPISAGGTPNINAHNSFCAGATCRFNIIYDQSGSGNHLTAGTSVPGDPPQGSQDRGPNPDGSDFIAAPGGAPVTLNGDAAYGVFIAPLTGYRNNVGTNMPTGTAPEGMYWVIDGTHYNSFCCFDFGNAEKTDTDQGNTTMEALSFGSSVGSIPGAGSGPWIQADLEDGLFAGGGTESENPQNTPITARFQTGTLKGDSTNLWSIRGGDATISSLTTYWSGARPQPAPGTGNIAAGRTYYPMHKKGGIILGIGGDNSNTAVGTFYEGAIVTGYPSNATENAVQANIAAASYATASLNSAPLTIGSKVSFQVDGQSGQYIINNAGSVEIQGVSTTPQKQGATFYVRQGNGFSECYSFESELTAGEFLRHYAYQLYCDSSSNSRSPSTWADDSTFCSETGVASASTTSFRSWSYPTRWFRLVNNNLVYIGAQGGPYPQDAPANFATQASWTIINGGLA